MDVTHRKPIPCKVDIDTSIYFFSIKYTKNTQISIKRYLIWILRWEIPTNSNLMWHVIDQKWIYLGVNTCFGVYNTFSTLIIIFLCLTYFEVCDPLPHSTDDPANLVTQQ